MKELDVDFIGGQGPLTKDEEKKVSEFIKAQKFYNPALDQYSNIDFFPEKTKRAKEALNKPGVIEWLKNLETNKKEVAEKLTNP